MKEAQEVFEIDYNDVFDIYIKQLKLNPNFTKDSYVDRIRENFNFIALQNQVLFLHNRSKKYKKASKQIIENLMALLKEGSVGHFIKRSEFANSKEGMYPNYPDAPGAFNV